MVSRVAQTTKAKLQNAGHKRGHNALKATAIATAVVAWPDGMVP